MKHDLLLGVLFALLMVPILIGMLRAQRRNFTGLDVSNTTGSHDGAFTRSAEVAIAPYLLLTFGTDAAKQVKLNTAATRPIGTACDEAAAGKPVGVIPIANGTPKIVIASKAIAAGVRVYGTAGGKVTDAVVAGAYLVGESLTAAGADGDEMEVLPLSPVVNP